jgi:membrane-associated protease RseP (regulator of RpoE activity)
MAEAATRVRALSRVPFMNVALFLATIVTTLVAGASQASFRVTTHATGPVASVLSEAWAIAVAGLPFSAALIGILLSHEMGHYLLARAYGVDATLPFFIPMPIGQVGTFGAVIRIRSGLPSRRATLDIGAAGPFAGFAVAVPLLAWGLAHSEIRPVGDAVLQSPPVGLWQLLRGWAAGDQLLASGVQHFGDSLVSWGVQRLVLGPLPAGTDVFLHPVAFAAWIGLFITTLNLIPIGQLDGGHVTYALLGRRGARAFSRLVAWGLLGAGLFLSWNWLVWWLVTRLLVGYGHPPAYDEAPLDPARKAWSLLALAMFAATFIPIPVSL